MVQRSLFETERCALAYVELDGSSRLLVEWERSPGALFESELRASEAGFVLGLCPLSHANAEALRSVDPFTAPSTLGASGVTIGMGDRLGQAGPGHLRAVRAFEALPVLAQQSPRELTLTRRCFSEVLDAATWAVFREGFRLPWGADGDHVKTEDQVRDALSAGFTMITADVSDFLPSPEKASGPPDAVYHDALEQAARLYRAAVDAAGEGRFDFELSVDETSVPTTAPAHEHIARECARKGIHLTSLAPRFVGEFEKSIDYIGDTGEFERTFGEHAALARRFGYRLSVHSGSDKLSIYPSIGRLTGGRFHIKTSGTSWLEALRVIACREPALFADLYAAGLAGYANASRLYRVSPDLSRLPSAEALSAGSMPELLDANDARRVLHITFGEILGNRSLADRIHRAVAAASSVYYDALERHFRRHLSALGVPPREAAGPRPADQ